MFPPRNVLFLLMYVGRYKCKGLIEDWLCRGEDPQFNLPNGNILSYTYLLRYMFIVIHRRPTCQINKITIAPAI